MDNESSVAGGTSFVILSVSIVGILATALLLLSYYLFITRCGLFFFWRSDHRDVDVAIEHHHNLHIRGLQAAAIRRIPTFRYQISSSSSSKERESVVVDCAVCLADFRQGERLRQLPSCRHAFHIDCIDAWLQATANCPLCRATVSDNFEAAALFLMSTEQQDHIVIDVVSSEDDHIVIDVVSSSSSESSPSPPEDGQQPVMARSRRSLSMDSSTDKRFYLALQRMLHHHQEQGQAGDATKSPATTSTPRSQLRRSFFSFSHSRSATILPL